MIFLWKLQIFQNLSNVAASSAIRSNFFRRWISRSNVRHRSCRFYGRYDWGGCGACRQSRIPGARQSSSSLRSSAWMLCCWRTSTRRNTGVYSTWSNRRRGARRLRNVTTSRQWSRALSSSGSSSRCNCCRASRVCMLGCIPTVWKWSRTLRPRAWFFCCRSVSPCRSTAVYSTNSCRCCYSTCTVYWLNLIVPACY